MKDWVLGRRFMEEQPGNGGEGGGGGGAGGSASNGSGGEPPASQGGDDPDDPGKGEEEHNNALGEELNKGGDPKPGDKPNGDQQPEKKDPPPDPNAPTEEEVKAYKDALKADAEAFGKDAKFDQRYVDRLPGLFKKHGIAPDKACQLANDFAKMQKEVEKDTAEKVAKFREWRAGEMKKMNDAYTATYDKAGRDDIARAIMHFFPKDSPMFHAVCNTEVGVDPGFLKAMKFIGERLPKSGAPGATAGAGATGAKSLSDSFMGL